MIQQKSTAQSSRTTNVELLALKVINLRPELTPQTTHYTKANTYDPETVNFTGETEKCYFNNNWSIKPLDENLNLINSDENRESSLGYNKDFENRNSDWLKGRDDALGRVKKRKHTFPNSYKQLVVRFAERFGLTEACKEYKLTKRNIKRWQQDDLGLKNGPGRKTANPAMEHEMLVWVEDYISREKKLPKRKLIIDQARNFLSDVFKASKGWCDKFLKRNKLRFAELIRDRV